MGTRTQALSNDLPPPPAQALRNGLAAVSKWLAARVCWWDLRASWLELLWRHRVSSAPMEGKRMMQMEAALGQVGWGVGGGGGG